MFGRSDERRGERKLIEDYFRDIGTILAGLTPGNLDQALAFARLPEHIRGYGHVKEQHLAEVLPRWQAAMAAWGKPARQREAA